MEVTINSGGGYKSSGGQFRFNIISCTDFMEKLLRTFEMTQMTYKTRGARSVMVFSIEALHGGFRERGEWCKRKLGSRESGVKKTREQGAKESILLSRGRKG